MYDDRVNRITFDVETYAGEDEMFADVAKMLQILTRNGEICTFEEEDCGIYLLQHNYADREFDDLYPNWLTTDEEEQVALFRENNSTDKLPQAFPQEDE